MTEAIIRGTPKEIAALVLAVQGQQGEITMSPEEIIGKAVRSAIDGIAEKSQDSSLPLSGT